MNTTIVKLGGSLFGSPQCDGWLAALAGASGRLVIVAGGGPFADAVRAAQDTIGFDDETAHHMALLAMEQAALALAARSKTFMPAASLAEMREAAVRGRIPIWLPSAMVLAAPDVPASWEATSDSLSAWLAARLGARRLLLVKSRDVRAPVSVRWLADHGIVDKLFPAFAQAGRAEIFVAGPAALATACDYFQKGEIPGTPVMVERVGA